MILLFQYMYALVGCRYCLRDDAVRTAARAVVLSFSSLTLALSVGVVLDATAVPQQLGENAQVPEGSSVLQRPDTKAAVGNGHPTLVPHR